MANVGVPGETRRYRFKAERGDRFYLDFDDDADFNPANYWLVPTGKPLSDAIVEGGFIREPDTIVIPANGNYDLVLRGDKDNVGRVPFTFWTTTRNVRDVAWGQSINASFAKPGEVDAYRLRASAGDRLDLDVIPVEDGDGIRNFGSYTITRLGGFGDNTVADGSFCCEESVVLPSTGTYLISVQGWKDRTHPYSITFARG